MKLYGPIQQIPPGLLGFLQLKNQGLGLGDLPDTLQGVLELRDWLLHADARNSGRYERNIAASSSGIGAFNTPGPLLVPDSEWWYVHNFTVLSSNLAAGDSVQLGGAWLVDRALPNPSFYLVSLPQGGGLHTGVNRAAIASGGGFFVPPGAELGFYHEITTAAAVNVSGYVRYTPLPI